VETAVEVVVELDETKETKKTKMENENNADTTMITTVGLVDSTSTPHTPAQHADMLQIKPTTKKKQPHPIQWVDHNETCI
jgi:hypothetical protein